MKVLITLILIIIGGSLFGQVNYITYTNNPGQTWSVTTTGSTRNKTVNLNLKQTPAAVGLPSNTAALLQQKSDSLKNAYNLINSLSTRLAKMESETFYYLKPGLGIDIKKVGDTVIVSRNP